METEMEEDDKPEESIEDSTLLPELVENPMEKWMAISPEEHPVDHSLDTPMERPVDHSSDNQGGMQ